METSDPQSPGAQGTAAPARDAAHLARLFAERLNAIDPGFGIESMVLSASHTEPLAAAQVSSCPSGNGAPASTSPAVLAPLLDRLGNRFGFPRKEVRERYRSHGGKFWSTGECGGLELVIGRDGNLIARSARNDRRRIWRWPAGDNCP